MTDFETNIFQNQLVIMPTKHFSRTVIDKNICLCIVIVNHTEMSLISSKFYFTNISHYVIIKS